MSFDYQKAARILVHAMAHGDKHAADKFGVTTRTVINHRQRLDADPILAQVFRAQAQGASGWHAARREALEDIYGRIKELAKTNFDPAQMKALVTFTTQSGELEMNHEMNLEEKGLEDGPAVLARISSEESRIAEDDEELDEDVDSQSTRKKAASQES